MNSTFKGKLFLHVDKTYKDHERSISILIPILLNPYEESVNKTSSVFIKVFKGLNYLS